MEGPLYTSDFVKELTSLGVAFRDRLLLLLVLLLLPRLLLLLLLLHLLLLLLRRRRWESFRFGFPLQFGLRKLAS